MTNTNSDTEHQYLLSKAQPFAEKLLSEHGEFFPYGMALDSSGKVIAVSINSTTEQPSSKEVIESLLRAFKVGANNGQYKATALVYDASITLSDSGRKSDAIAVNIEHSNGYAATFYTTYKLQGKKLILDETFSERSEQKVFK